MENVRRNFLKFVTTGGAVALVGGLVGVGYLRRSYARDSLRADLLREVSPLLADKAAKELDELPTAACEQIRTYFDGKCLNVNAFVTEVCGRSFAEKLGGCSTDAQKHQLLNVAFAQKVVSPIEVLNRVETIARETGATLDRNWIGCCGKIKQSWNVPLAKYGSSKQMLDVSALAEPLIIAELENAKGVAYPLGERPTITGTIEAIGESAILLLALENLSPVIALPVFVVEALAYVWEWMLGQIANQAADFQASITERLSLLGRRVGSNCQDEFRKRVADLQTFQEQSLNEVATRTADETIRNLF